MFAQRISKAAILRPRLITRDGKRVDCVPSLDAPEATLVVSFHGLTDAEQRAALAAFPGGKRFRLKAG